MSSAATKPGLFQQMHQRAQQKALSKFSTFHARWAENLGATADYQAQIMHMLAQPEHAHLERFYFGHQLDGAARTLAELGMDGRLRRTDMVGHLIAEGWQQAGHWRRAKEHWSPEQCASAERLQQLLNQQHSARGRNTYLRKMMIERMPPEARSFAGHLLSEADGLAADATVMGHMGQMTARQSMKEIATTLGGELEAARRMDPAALAALNAETSGIYQYMQGLKSFHLHPSAGATAPILADMEPALQTITHEMAGAVRHKPVASVRNAAKSVTPTLTESKDPKGLVIGCTIAAAAVVGAWLLAEHERSQQASRRIGF